MKNNTDEPYIKICCGLIADRLDWGNSDSWNNQDFENLAALIQEATGVALSATTLKRIWGRVKYNSAPTATTLNTLVQFLGYDHWRAFRQSQEGPAAGTRENPAAAGMVSPGGNAANPPEQDTKPGLLSTVTKKENAANPPEQDTKPGLLSTITKKENAANPPEQDTKPGLSSPITKKRTYIWAAIAMGILILTGILSLNFTGNKKSATPVNPAAYQFSSRKVITEGVPNSVIFDYNASASPEDSVYIQQNWDPSKRIKVSKLQHQATSVYYYPGHFQARLVVGGQIVKEHSLLIKTRGWLPMIEQTPVPVYFTEKEALTGNELGLRTTDILSKNIPLQPEAPWVRYSNMGNWEPATTHHFRFEAELRNDFGEGSAVCRYSEMYLLCNGGAIIIPLAGKGCVSELNILLAGQYFSGKENDLSGLGVDFDHWVKLDCIAENGQFRVLVDGKPAFQTAITGKELRISGVSFRFKGSGRIRNVSLSGNQPARAG